MPYIITTTRPLTSRQRHAMESATRTRRAVATFDEARGEVIRHITTPFAWDLALDGGTIGPLPDGTVIEVRHVDWIAMRKLAGSLPVRTHNKPAVLDAYNAR